MFVKCVSYLFRVVIGGLILMKPPDLREFCNWRSACHGFQVVWLSDPHAPHPQEGCFLIGRLIAWSNQSAVMRSRQLSPPFSLQSLFSFRSCFLISLNWIREYNNKACLCKIKFSVSHRSKGANKLFDQIILVSNNGQNIGINQ